MIIGDHKKLATIIVSRMGKDGDSEATPEDDGGDPMQAAAADLLHAIETKSASAISDAFKAMFLACESEPHSEADDPED